MREHVNVSCQIRNVTSRRVQGLGPRLATPLWPENDMSIIHTRGGPSDTVESQKPTAHRSAHGLQRGEVDGEEAGVDEHPGAMFSDATAPKTVYFRILDVTPSQSKFLKLPPAAGGDHMNPSDMLVSICHKASSK